MAKILNFDLSEERLLCMAEEMVDEHNYIAALKMLNKNAGINGDSDRSLMLYAEIFDDMDLYEKCVNGWYKYLDYAEDADPEDLSDCYEGLAVAYMNLGDQARSAHYYHKLLTGTEGIDEEMREQILSDFLAMDENPLKFAYPPEIADRTEFIKNGIEYMKQNEYELAVAEFDMVEERNPKYNTARNYIAMCKIICDKADEAEEECRGILSRDPENVQALTTLAAVKTETGNRDESLALAKELLKIKLRDTDDVYKVATVCCENGLHAEAYKLFKRLTEENELTYDLSVLYFKAVAAFNCGKLDEALGIFDDISVIYPESVTSRYFYKQAKEMRETRVIKELEYFYRLPADLREKSVQMLAAVMQLNKSQAAMLADEVDLSDCVRWCFEENDMKGDEVKHLAAHVAAKVGLDDIVRDILLNAFVSDHIKISLLTTLQERNREGSVGVVIYHLYNRFILRKIEIGKRKKSVFIRAYAKLAAHFAALDDENGAMFKQATESLYFKLEKEERLNDARSEKAVAAAIYMQSGECIKGLSGEDVYKFFDVTEAQVKKLLGDV